MKQIHVLCLFFLLLGLQLRSQNPIPFNSSVVSKYISEANGYSPIYSSKSPVLYGGYIKNHPYFIEDKFVEGMLCFDGVVYPKTLMKLDLYKNELIVLSPLNRQLLVLSGELVDFAVLHGYHIIYHSKERARNSSLDEGYYLLLHDGELTVLEKQGYLLKEEVGNEVELSFSKKNIKYFILKDSVCCIVKNKKSALSTFISHKKELNRYIKQEKLSFRKDAEKAIVAVVKHYEHLNY